MVSYKNSPIVHSRLFRSPEEASNTSITWAQSRRNWKPFPGPSYVGDIDVPLLRTWDRMSGSQPDDAGHMFARNREQQLRTEDVRKETLQLHLNHRNWAVATPYISFQASEQRLRELANLRKARPSRETQTITVIDPEVRLRAGWPVLSVGEEMRFYEIQQDPYRYPSEEHNDHYVCLWRVEKEEIVGHWRWDDLSQDPDWYNTEILPAFQHFRQERRRREQEEQQRLEQERQQALAESQVDDILGAMGALGLDDAVAGSSSEQSPIHSIQGIEQAEDSGIGNDDEPEGTHIRAML
ncbi:hypothetical protein LCI18_002081 [Fusarium solani-melongenae]|uniref:Uncharacterized protein n=1 Tax=Fusarium solani subsp. cucurbitae TaxID=2747967 RepID=A0ACD3YRB8_FUSSC|nr:hypothetical protein LCI18_002081 [Fusarium solani-melongenae]